MLAFLTGACRSPSPPAGDPPHDAATDSSLSPSRASWAPPPDSPCKLGPDVLALPPAKGKCDDHECTAAYGTCTWGGIGCSEVCARLTSDFGHTCSDASECEGICEVSKKIPPGTVTTGKCSETKVHFGCHNPVVKGVVGVGELCAD